MEEIPNHYQVVTRVEIVKVDPDGRWLSGAERLSFENRTTSGPLTLDEVGALLTKYHRVAEGLAESVG